MLVNGIVSINEMIDFDKRIMKACPIFKVDFVKTYDSVSWSFLNDMLIKSKFNDKCVNLCVCMYKNDNSAKDSLSDVLMMTTIIKISGNNFHPF